MFCYSTPVVSAITGMMVLPEKKSIRFGKIRNYRDNDGIHSDSLQRTDKLSLRLSGQFLPERKPRAFLTHAYI